MTPNQEAHTFIVSLEKKVEPLFKKNAIAYWNATITGQKRWYKKHEEIEIQTQKIFENKTLFEKIETIRKLEITDPILKREIELLYLDFLENRVDPKLNTELVRLSSKVTSKFNTHRAKINGREVTDNEIRKILKSEHDCEIRKRTWEASKQIGKAVAGDLIALIKKRNKAAKSLGFKNYYQMQLIFQEQTEKEVFGVLDGLAKLTEKPYRKLKKEIDSLVAKKFNISSKKVMPWHYEDVFFQEPPEIFELNLDDFFKSRDVVAITKKYYQKLGMPVADILRNSDLYEKTGKEQHAYCMNVDRRGDIRILANVHPSEHWLGTMLHELGHAIYDKHLDKNVPFFLREPSHTFTTEAIAELFGRQTHNPFWLNWATGGKFKKEIFKLAPKLAASQRARMLIFARWVMVMANFERAMYKNPKQDLNSLWWKLVEKYQLVKRPKDRKYPDWAAKIHLTSSPVYYHNYLLGEIMASQLIAYIRKTIKKDNSFILTKGTGLYLKNKIFAPANILRWDALLKFATGKDLSPEYFAKDFI